MRVISCNVNGLRSAYRKGFLGWAKAQDADFICLQEIKAQDADLQAEYFQLPGYQLYTHCADRKGYSGVAIYSKHLPDSVMRGLGWPCADEEGRYLELNIKGLKIASIYFPSGTSGDHRQALKYEFMSNYYERFLKTYQTSSQPVIICGDWNIAHQAIDLKNWRVNQKNSGFLPEERAWLDQLFEDECWVDAFRQCNTQAEEYSWWTYRGQARARNVGWRIDYQIISRALKEQIINAVIDRSEVFSDHAPLVFDYAYSPFAECVD
ncbi:MAG: exodeoxyribonuclease III [Legionellales bacterium]|nr:exodeoxyribonuclease III [Legionellales bacterium]